MMLHKKSQSSHLLKLLALLPIVGVTLALNAETVTNVVYQQPQKKIIKKGKKNATVKMGPVNEIVVTEQVPDVQEEVKPVEMPNGMKVEKQEKDTYDVVEQMPQFPGGPAALMQFLSQNIRYPETAYKAGDQGRVIVKFIVEKDGSISDAQTVKSVSPELDAEALRVINSMPNWMPGMQNGEPVRVKYVVPVTFRLQGKAEKSVEKYILEIDGKVVDDKEIGEIPPGDIENMYIDKGKNGQPKKILITTKKNKE